MGETSPRCGASGLSSVCALRLATVDPGFVPCKALFRPQTFIANFLAILGNLFLEIYFWIFLFLIGCYSQQIQIQLGVFDAIESMASVTLDFAFGPTPSTRCHERLHFSNETGIDHSWGHLSEVLPFFPLEFLFTSSPAACSPLFSL
jgi:hypothetical protein